MKYIRKILVAALMLCLLASMTACGGSKDGSAASNSKFTGSWKIKSFEAMGMEFTIDQLSSLGLGDDELEMMKDFSIEIKEDNTYTFTAGGNSVDGKWTETDTSITLEMDDTSVTAKLDGSDVSMDMSEIAGIDMNAKFERVDS